MVNINLLNKCFDLLHAKILEEQSDTGLKTVSFIEGIPFAEEGYKYDVWNEAHAIIEAVPWDSPDLIGSGIIKKAVLDALRVQPVPGWTQNLVDWNDILYFDDLKRTKDLEKGLYELYHNGNDEVAFKSIMAVVKNKFALISYLFFIKDKDRYAVVRPNNFAWRFQAIGVKKPCTTPCSWNNYVTFMSVLQEVREFLADKMGDVSLLDAHSFVWMMWKIKDEVYK